MSFSGYDTALEMRRLIETVAAGVVNKLRPRPRYGAVQSIDDENAKCTVLFVGDTEAVEVNTGSLIPSHVGQRVKVEGLGVDKCVTALYGNEGVTIHAASTGPFVKLARIFTGTRKEVTLDASTPDQLKVQFSSGGTDSGSWLFNSDGTAYYNTETEANRIHLGPEDVKISIIPDQADLNDYIETGVYLQHYNASIPAGGGNYPDGRAGILEVFDNTTGPFTLGTYSHVAQRFTTYLGDVWERRHYSGWQPWEQVPTLVHNPMPNPTAATGFSLESFESFTMGPMLSWTARVTRTGADMTSNSWGNYGDTTVLEIPAGWRPVGLPVSTTFQTGYLSGGFTVWPDGWAKLRDFSGTGTIETGHLLDITVPLYKYE